MATNYTICVESSEIQDDWSTGIQKLVFTCSIENFMGINFDPWDEEDMQLIARELLTQAKILTALTKQD